MNPIGFTFISSLETITGTRISLECPVIQVREAENVTDPEIVSPTKIISCYKCSKLFSSQKKLDQHKRKYELVRARKILRPGINI